MYSNIFSIEDPTIPTVLIKFIKAVSVLDTLVPPAEDTRDAVPLNPPSSSLPSPHPQPFPSPNQHPFPSRHPKNLALIIPISTVGSIVVIILILASIVMLRKDRLEANGEDNINKMGYL